MLRLARAPVHFLCCPVACRQLLSKAKHELQESKKDEKQRADNKAAASCATIKHISLSQSNVNSLRREIVVC